MNDPDSPGLWYETTQRAFVWATWNIHDMIIVIDIDGDLIPQKERIKQKMNFVRCEMKPPLKEK